MISITMKTGSKLSAIALIFCFVLASNLPKPIETIAGNNYPQTLRQLAGATLPVDHRTQYQLLDANSLGPSDTALQMASNLLQTQRAPATASDTARGHYAFEVAPNMEPPSVPKPPFKPVESTCVGSDMFAPFTYKDTLCGNLYHGKVPRNPMGQLVDKQSYPFELIKNKTLQFLAKSLPILKDEASSLPRVYKYNNLPPNQLLNPTNIQSPLGHEHLDRLNQRHLDLYPAMAHPEEYAAPPFIRKKRSAIMLPNQPQQHQQAAAIEVAELTSNTTLVVSSAHSANGRLLSARSADGIAMITKDGLRPIAMGANVNGASVRVRGQDEQQRAGQSLGGAKSSGSPSGHQQSQQQQQKQLKSHAANQIGSIGQTQPTANTISGQEHASESAQTLELASTNSNAAHTNSRQQQQRSANPLPSDHQQRGQQSDSTPSVVARNSGGQSQQQQQQQQQQQSSANPQRVAPAATLVQRRPAGSGGNAAQRCSSGSAFMQAVCQAATALIEPDAEPSWMQRFKQAATLYNLYESVTNPAPQSPNANSLLTFWNSLSSNLGGASGGSASEKYSTSDEANAIPDHGVVFKSAMAATNSGQSGGSKASPPVSPAVSSITTILNLLNPLISLFQPSLQRADSSSSSTLSSGSSNQANQSSGQNVPTSRNNSQMQTGGGGLLSNGLKTMANLLITSFSTAYLVDWLTGSNIISPMLTTTSFARRKNPFDRSETFAPASLAAMQSAKQLSPAAIATNEMPKAPPTPCPSKEELVAPTFARNYQGHWKYIVQIPSEGYFTQTIQKSVCERQKCEFTEGYCHEAPRWVSLLVAEIYYPHATAPQAQQLPTSAAGELMNERLMFDANGQFMTAAPSTSQLQQAALGASQHQARSRSGHQHHQQDPLQMIDSLNTYNHHNLNNLFLNSAAELGLDTTNVAQMRQFADAHNYQFVQRHGQQLPGSGPAYHHYSYHQQPSASQSGQVAQQAEARSSNNADQIARQQQLYTTATWLQPATQFYIQPQQTQQVLSQEQIQQLAMRLIQANPGKTPQELINMIQQRQLMRKKRDSSDSDTNRQQTTPVMASQQQQFGHKLDQTSGQINGNQQMARSHANQQAPHQQTVSSAASAENLASINELNQLPQQQQQQQQTYQQPFDLTGLSAPAQLSSSQSHYQQPIAGVRSQINAFQQAPRTHQVDQQKISQLPANSQQQLAFNAANQHSQAIHNQPSQTQTDQLTASSDLNAGGAGQGAGTANEPLVECDGHDARGCYVVRVYYDWFLVNGSCKCWKMGATDQQRSGQPQSSSSGANFIRRIFTAG